MRLAIIAATALIAATAATLAFVTAGIVMLSRVEEIDA